MIRRILLGAIPTIVVGFAVLTLNAKQPGGIALNQVKHSTAKSSGHTAAKTPAARNSKTKSTPSHAAEEHRGHYGNYRGYRSYRGYYGYRGYRGYYVSGEE